MSVNEGAGGRRYIEVETEVPGTPEEVWHAIATGPGISSWFTPSDVEERVGGNIVFHLGDVDNSVGTITAWEPPHRLAYEEPDWSPPAPPLATEHIVEARSGGTCVVRIVSSLFTSSDEWDDQLESMDEGWRPMLEILRLVMTHFRGETAVMMQQMWSTKMSHADAWSAVAGPLGLNTAMAGATVAANGSGTPPFAGVVERSDAHDTMHSVLLRLTEPAPGIASVIAHGAGESTYVAIGFFLFGSGAAEIVEREGPRWKAFLEGVAPRAE